MAPGTQVRKIDKLWRDVVSRTMVYTALLVFMHEVRHNSNPKRGYSTATASGGGLFLSNIKRKRGVNASLNTYA